MAFHLSAFVNTNAVTAFVIAELRAKQQMRNLVRNHTMVNEGSSFKVPGLGSITIGDYDGTAITTQALSDESVTINLSEKKYFSFIADKVDSAQEAYNTLPAYVEKAGNTLAETADTYISTVAAAGAGLSVAGIALDEDNVLAWVADMGEQLDNYNAPRGNRWLVVPPFASASIAVNNIETASTTDEAARIEGFMGRYLGFDVYVSTNLTNESGVYSAIAGFPEAIDFVENVNNVEMQPSESLFGTQVKGLHVYGCSVTQPSGVVTSQISKG